jgi:hypothetical protein
MHLLVLYEDKDRILASCVLIYSVLDITQKEKISLNW